MLSDSLRDRLTDRMTVGKVTVIVDLANPNRIAPVFWTDTAGSGGIPRTDILLHCSLFCGK